jgi:hypothetical protein
LSARVGRASVEDTQKMIIIESYSFRAREH